jgi:hypothetical protein
VQLEQPTAPAASAPATVKHGDNPGQPGYRRGCRCAVCRDGHAEHNRAWREAKRQRETDEALADAAPLIPPTPPADLQSVPTLDFDTAAGSLEQAFDLDLTEPDNRVAFARTLIGVAKYNARVLDQVPLHGRMDLISPVQIRLFDVLQRIGLLGFAGFSDAPKTGDGEQGAEAADEDGISASAARMLEQLATLTQPAVQPDAPVDQ